MWALNRGLRPLLRFLSHCINKHILWPINEDFEFKFVGLDARTPTEQADLATKQVKTYKTVDEIRAEEDLPPLPEKQGEIILDPTWMQAHMAAQGGGEMPEGEEEGNEEAANEEPTNGKEVDFQTLLSQYEEDEEEDMENSLTRSWVMEL